MRVTPLNYPESLDEQEQRSRSNDDDSEQDLGDDLPNTRPGSGMARPPSLATAPYLIPLHFPSFLN
ncbi:hypothetical protein FRC08_012523 [Ceratobasidium sp. 394]|nr:hypothetical protein FRC08_012523 [Ceratobasidium sp. 394]